MGSPMTAPDTIDTPATDFSDDIAWDEEELEAPACDLSNPDICESCQ